MNLTKITKFLIYTFVFTIGICSTIALWIFIDSRKVDRHLPENVISAFAYSLMTNDERRAKSLVVIEKWQEIDNWNEQHRAVHCRLPLKDLVGGSEDIRKDSNGEKYSIMLIEDCANYSNLYYFVVLDITLEKNQDGWVINNWETPCEYSSSDFTNKCFESFYERAYSDSS